MVLRVQFWLKPKLHTFSNNKLGHLQNLPGLSSFHYNYLVSSSQPLKCRIIPFYSFSSDLWIYCFCNTLFLYESTPSRSVQNRKTWKDCTFVTNGNYIRFIISHLSTSSARNILFLPLKNKSLKKLSQKTHLR